MNVFFRILSLASVVAVLAAGCGTPQPKAYVIFIDPKTSSSVPVDLVAVTDADFDDFMAYPVSRYWLPHDPVRDAADKIKVQISGGIASPSELKVTDTHWRQWLHRGVTHLVVIADLHGDDFKDAGKLDPRRRDIDLKKRFDSKTIDVEIQDRAVKITTPFK